MPQYERRPEATPKLTFSSQPNVGVTPPSTRSAAPLVAEDSGMRIIACGRTRFSDRDLSGAGRAGLRRVPFPYTPRKNDILLIEGRHYSPDKFLAQIKPDFDQLYDEAGGRR